MPYLECFLRVGLCRQSVTLAANSRSAFLGGLLLWLTVTPAPAQTYSILHNFDGTNGATPHAGLVLSGTTLYGTTSSGGISNCGTVFKMNLDGSGYAVLRHFAGSNGRDPEADLLLADSTLYGTTEMGGLHNYGTLFQLNTDGSGYSVLHSFGDNGDGTMPTGSLVLSGTTLYGTTYAGGGASQGTVFRINTNGSGYVLLHSFDGMAPYPQGGLILSGARLYGTTRSVSSLNRGTVFALSTNGSGYNTLRTFTGTDGSDPYAGLVASGATLYGTTDGGGDYSAGTVFRLTTNGGAFALLKSFTASGWSGPLGSLVLAGGTLYGTTAINVFQLNTDGSGYSELKQFTTREGIQSYAGVVLAGTKLYGTTALGGAFNLGVIFSLTVPPPTIATPPTNQSAAVGFTVDITVAAAGSLPLSYQWFFNGTNALVGATNAILELTDVQVAQAGAYTVVVTNLFGAVTSAPALLSVVGLPPTVHASPTNQAVTVGSTAAFTVDAAGSLPLAYQWLFNNTNAIPGATDFLLTLANVQPSQSGAYRVVVTNAFGAVTSSPAVLNVIGVRPSIVTTPRSQTTWIGGPVAFSVDASGSAPLSYQWLFDQSNALAGATNALLQLTNVQTAQAGTYTVVVTNAFGTVTTTPAILIVTSLQPLGICTEPALRAALALGGVVTFACDGTITLADTISIATNTVLDGMGRQVTISGGNAVRVFQIRTNATLTLTHLTIADGWSTNGAGIFNDGGVLNLLDVVMRSNHAAALGGSPLEGGGVLNRGGTVTATSCAFRGNAARAPGYVPHGFAPPARGGALRNVSGTVTLQDCSFTANGAFGGGSDFAPGSEGAGGAIHNSGTLNARRCTFLQNSAAGGPGSSYSAFAQQIVGSQGGTASGGALCNLGLLVVDGCAFASNTVAGGVGGTGGGGFNCDQGGDMAGAAGGAGGSANGGALCNEGVAELANVTLAENTAAGGAGGAGGSGGSCRRSGGVGGLGGAGGGGGSGFGAISGMVTLTNCTVAFNAATAGQGGAGGAGGWGSGAPGSTGPSGPGGTNGLASGGIHGGWLVNTLLATNSPGGNGSGMITDAGHNLSSDASCAFTNAGSLNNTDPRLGPLADNGGPTLTMALLPGSPAIDAGSASAAPPTDQRGHPRPVGLAADIGAYEYGSTPRLRISPLQAGALEVLLYDVSGPSCRLLTSTNLATWLPAATNQIGADGTALFQLSVGAGEVRRFYRALWAPPAGSLSR